METFSEQLARVEQMADDEDCETWDLSDNDRCALAAVLADRRRIGSKRLREFVGWLSGDIPELHEVEVPRLADSLDRFLATVEPTTPEGGSR